MDQQLQDMARDLQHVARDLLERDPLPAVATVNGQVVSVVYVTAPATFSGVIGGYSTVTGDDDDQPQTGRATNVRSSSGFATSLRTQPSVTRQSLQPSDASPSSSQGSYAYPPNTLAQNPTATAAFGAGSNNSHSSSSSSSSEGMSMGAKLGLAVGITGAIGIMAILALFLLARKRKQKRQQEQLESEKREISKPVVANTNAQASPEAPRLSLRPVSRLMFTGGAQQKNRLSQGNMLAATSEPGSTKLRSLSPIPPQAQAPRPSQDRPRNGDNPFKDPENPFADPEKATAGVPFAAARSPVSPVTPRGPANAEIPKDQRISGPNGESFPVPQSQGPVPGQAPRSGPAPIIVPSVTTHYELPAAPSPVVAQGPGPEGPQGNVYRILMDFRPTMEDELELRAGQLVRMLHEYDDGWALCIRLDRSQQGVVPRTCLAAKPSKPRPGPPPMNGPHGQRRGPPGHPGQQGPSAASGAQGPVPNPPYPQGPAPLRSQSPAPTSIAPGAFNQPPRPLSPGPRPQLQPQKRSMSPGPYGAGGPQPMAPIQQRRRSNSAGALAMPPRGGVPSEPTRLEPTLPTIRSNSPGLAM